ncbi:MAG: DUF2924 domain-containing protein [Bryobacter sp.]|nr:DUF2924 domain-containing protein [Bryobacter sp.]
MKKTLRQQIDELAAMDVAALQTRHLEFFGKETTCAHRQFLFRKLAWHLQAKAEDGLQKSAIELARSHKTLFGANGVTNARQIACFAESAQPITSFSGAHDGAKNLTVSYTDSQAITRTFRVDENLNLLPKTKPKGLPSEPPLNNPGKTPSRIHASIGPSFQYATST